MSGINTNHFTPRPRYGDSILDCTFGYTAPGNKTRYNSDGTFTYGGFNSDGSFNSR